MDTLEFAFHIDVNVEVELPVSLDCDSGKLPDHAFTEVGAEG